MAKKGYAGKTDECQARESYTKSLHAIAPKKAERSSFG